MRKPIAIYPYCAELLPIVRYFERCQDDYVISWLISPPGLGIGGRDAAYVCNHPDTGIIVTDDACIAEVSWEVLFLCHPKQPDIINDGQLAVMAKRTLDAGGKIVYFDNNIKNSLAAMNDFLPKYRNRLMPYTESVKSYPYVDMGNGHKQLRSPVVLVGGLITGEDSFHVLAALAVCLRRHGMNPAVFSQHIAGGMLGFHSLVPDLGNDAISLIEKIETINNWIANIEHHEMPDIILVEAPDSVLRYNNTVPNGYGIYTYLICQAIEPDMFVLCLPCDVADNSLIEALSSDIAIRLGSAITAVHVSNIVIDSADVLQAQTITSVRMGMEMVKNQLTRENGDRGIPVFDAVSDEADELGRLIMDLCTNANGG